MKLCRKVLLTCENIKNANLTLYSGAKSGSDPPQRSKKNTLKGPLFQAIILMGETFQASTTNIWEYKNAYITLYFGA